LALQREHAVAGVVREEGVGGSTRAGQSVDARHFHREGGGEKRNMNTKSDSGPRSRTVRALRLITGKT